MRCPVAIRVFAFALLAMSNIRLMAENATLPYLTLYKAQLELQKINRAHTNLLAVMTMESTSPDVKSSSLVVYINALSGKIPVEVGAAGNFSLPLDEKLRLENPPIIVNQPRGTMKLDCRVGILLGKVPNPVTYDRLLQPVRDYAAVQDEVRRTFPGATDIARQSIIGLKLTFSPNLKNASIIIHARDGARRLMMDKSGEIVVPLGPDLFEENPDVSFPGPPVTAGVASHPSEE